MLDFVETISDCQLVEPASDGVKFTWSRGDLYEKLDRVLLGEGWTKMFPSTRVTNLPRATSDHSPILVRCIGERQTSKTPFHFQNMWVRHHSFIQVVKELWETDTGARGMRNLQFKLLRVKKGLQLWNKEVFIDIFSKVKLAEEKATIAQMDYENEPSPERRCASNKAMAEFILALKMEEDFWRQKAAIRWVAEGERNTKFFQGWVRQKRLKAKIFEIQEGEEIISSDEGLRESAARYFQQLLSTDTVPLEDRSRT